MQGGASSKAVVPRGSRAAVPTRGPHDMQAVPMRQIRGPDGEMLLAPEGMTLYILDHDSQMTHKLTIYAMTSRICRIIGGCTENYDSFCQSGHIREVLYMLNNEPFVRVTTFSIVVITCL